MNESKTPPEEEIVTDAFRLSERAMVKELHDLLFTKDSQYRFRKEGIAREDFLEKFTRKALKRAVFGTPMSKKEGADYRKIEFYLDSCIEQGYISLGGTTNNKLKLTAKGYKFISWNYWGTFIGNAAPLFIAVLSLIVAVGTAYYTGKQANALQEQIQDSGKQQSASFVLDINTQLRDGSSSYSNIIGALANGSSINGFSTEEIDNYLVTWELVDDLVQNGVIDKNTAYDAFSYDVEAAYCSPYIKKYILATRASDLASGGSQDYGGFTNLARIFLTEDGNQPCSANYIDSISY